MFQNLLLLFQTAAKSGADKTAHESSSNLFSIIAEGGPIGITVVTVQLILSVITIYVFVERYLTLKKASEIDQGFMNNIKAHVVAGNMQAAKTLCQNTNSPVARMMAKGLSRIGKPLRDVHAAIENVGNLELQKLEANLSTLASIAGLAPMIGLLGTVIGMIISFQAMNTAEQITPQVLSGGIYHALIATAFGLTVGIIAFAGHNYLVARLDKVIFQMESSTTEFIDLLQDA